MSSSLTAENILRFLDNCQVISPYYFFMDLEHVYFNTANSRLTLYADDTRWAIVFEKSGHSNRGGRIELELNFFGNCLHNLDRGGAGDRYPCNMKLVSLIDDDDLEDITADFEEIALAAGAVKVLDRLVAIPTTLEGYAKWVPDIHDDTGFLDRPTYADLIRFLAYEYADLCRATDAEKRLCIPADLPEIMTVDAWHHRHYYQSSGAGESNGEAPSSYETFPMLAEILVTRDPTRFRPTLAPTNHWSNWPEAGSL
jgi:hypothetical protein